MNIFWWIREHASCVIHFGKRDNEDINDVRARHHIYTFCISVIFAPTVLQFYIFTLA